MKIPVNLIHGDYQTDVWNESQSNNKEPLLSLLNPEKWAENDTLTQQEQIDRSNLVQEQENEKQVILLKYCKNDSF